jgi:hypothetical protein
LSQNGNHRGHGSVKYTAGKFGEEKKLPEKEALMDTFAEIHSVDRLDNTVMLVDKESERHTNHHQVTLEEIQRRALEIHHEHGGVTGGYTLDDWLEAEHELEDTDGTGDGNEQVH